MARAEGLCKALIMRIPSFSQGDNALFLTYLRPTPGLARLVGSEGYGSWTSGRGRLHFVVHVQRLCHCPAIL